MSINFADFFSRILAESDKQVTRGLARTAATVGVQKDNVTMAERHRVLNFQGPGVTVADDPTQRRTNIYVGGSSLTSTSSQLVASSVSAKALSLWNGASNNAAPANWQTVAFNDTAWTNPVVATGGAATTIPNATKLWTTATPAGLTEIILIRHSFTLAAGTYQSISLTIQADNFIDAVYMNGTLIGSATNGVPGTSESNAKLSITASLLIAGTNVVAIQARNQDTTLSAAWTAYAIDSTVVTAAAGNTTTASAFLGASVAMPSANTYYDGPSVSLIAGTWLVSAAVDVLCPTNGTEVAAKLWNGTTVYVTGETWASVSGSASTTVVSAIVTLASTTTVKISAASQVANSTLQAALVVNGAGNNATYILAVKL
ncbi:MAG: hypothetical protein NVS2B16_25570 [Chloroflexota bacterium]